MAKHRVEVIDRATAAILAAKTPAERFAIASDMHRAARTIIRNRVEQLFRDASADSRQCEYLRRLLGNGANGCFEARR